MNEDNLSHFRARIAQGDVQQNSKELPETKVKLPGASYQIFHGSQENSSYAIGDEVVDQILLVQKDRKDGAMKVSRHLTMKPAHTGGVLTALEAGEKLAKELLRIPKDQWPQLPQLMGTGADDYSTVRCHLELFRDRLELKLSRTVVGGGSLPNWEWFKVGIVDVFDATRIIMAAHDLIPKDGADSSPYGDSEIPF